MDNEIKRFGLCLSGGGFRATLFHLGVVKYLRDAGLLSGVTHIFSVSGGSILAAHMLLNWEKYNGSEDDFEEMASEVVKFTQSDLRGRVIRKWLLSWVLFIPRFGCWLGKKIPLIKNIGAIKGCDWRITTFLEKAYCKFYKGKTLQDIKRENLPQLNILCTSLTTGRLFSFNNDGVTVVIEKGREVSYEEFPTGDIPLAKAVAASSAFPPVFSPVAISHNTLNVEVADFPNKQYLCDGGVYDNLGIRKLFLLQQLQQFNFDNIFLSDAGSAFSWMLDRPYNFILSLSIRASDLLMMRVGSLEYSEIESLPSDIATKIAICKIHVEKGKEIADSPLNKTTQRKLWQIRTDLNSFSSWEINALVQHGFAVARGACKKFDLDLARLKKAAWLPKITKDEWKAEYDLKANMEKAVRRNWNVFSFGDFNSYVSVFLLALILIIPFSFSIYGVVGAFLFPSRIEYQNKLLLVKDSNARVIELIEKSDNLIDLQSARNTLQNNLDSLPPEDFDHYKTQLVISTLDTRIKLKEVLARKNGAIVKVKFRIPGSPTDYFGTGFFISRDGYILTANPENVTPYKVELADGTEKEVKLIKHDSSKPFALLKLDGLQNDFFKCNFDLVAKLDDAIIAAGFIGGSDDLKSATGSVIATEDGLVRIKFDKDSQNSAKVPEFGLLGGPVINEKGELIGIYSEQTEDFRTVISIAAVKSSVSNISLLF